MNLPLLCLFLLSLSFLSYRHSKPWRFNKDMYLCYLNSSTRCSICGRCSTRRTSPAGRKHCRSFEVLRDHLGTSGSTLLCVLTKASMLGAHRAMCQLSRTLLMSRALQHHQQPATQPQGGGGALALATRWLTPRVTVIQDDRDLARASPRPP